MNWKLERKGFKVYFLSVQNDPSFMQGEISGRKLYRDHADASKLHRALWRNGGTWVPVGAPFKHDRLWHISAKNIIQRMFRWRTKVFYLPFKNVLAYWCHLLHLTDCRRVRDIRGGRFHAWNRVIRFTLQSLTSKLNGYEVFKAKVVDLLN